MPFNERGEIVRNSGSAGRRNFSERNRNNYSNPWFWITPIAYIVGAILFTALIIQISRDDSYESLNKSEFSEHDTSYLNSGLPAPPIEQDVSPDTSYSDTQNSTAAERKNPYGYGNGKITIYKTSKEVSNVKIIIDGKKIGTLSKTYSSNKYVCDHPSTISAILPAGNHTLSATDSRYSWKYDVSVFEGECTQRGLYPSESDIVLFNSKFATMLSGKWYGKIYEKDIDKWNSILLSCNLGKKEFKINYPSLGCMGTWVIYNANDEALNFEEDISFGFLNLHYSHLINVQIVNSKKIKVSYYLGKKVTATGTLSKLKN